MSKFHRQVETFERRMIGAALRRHGSVTAAARTLGVGALWLRLRIDELGVTDPVSGKPFPELALRIVDDG